MSATREITTGYMWPSCFYPFWYAFFDGEEEKHQYGSGETQEAAIEDLLALYGDEGEQS